MTLGILITKTSNLKHAAGIAHAASAKGHNVNMFLMDGAVRLLMDEDLAKLSAMQGISVYYCALNANQLCIDKPGIPSTVKSGSQYNNAKMFHDSDKVINL